MNSQFLADITEGAILAVIGLYFTLRGHGWIDKRLELDAIKAEKEVKARSLFRILGPIIILFAAILTISQLSIHK